MTTSGWAYSIIPMRVADLYAQPLCQLLISTEQRCSRTHRRLLCKTRSPFCDSCNGDRDSRLCGVTRATAVKARRAHSRARFALFSPFVSVVSVTPWLTAFRPRLTADPFTQIHPFVSHERRDRRRLSAVPGKPRPHRQLLPCAPQATRTENAERIDVQKRGTGAAKAIAPSAEDN